MFWAIHNEFLDVSGVNGFEATAQATLVVPRPEAVRVGEEARHRDEQKQHADDGQPDETASPVLAEMVARDGQRPVEVGVQDGQVGGDGRGGGRKDDLEASARRGGPQSCWGSGGAGYQKSGDVGVMSSSCRALRLQSPANILVKQYIRYERSSGLLSTAGSVTTSEGRAFS